MCTAGSARAAAALLLLLQLCAGTGDLLGLDALERKLVLQIWEKNFPDRKTVQSWMIRIMHSPPLSDVPKFLNWNFSSTHQLLDGLLQHLDNERSVQQQIMGLASFHAPSGLDSDDDDDDNEEGWRDGREVDIIKCFLGLSLMVANLNVMYINILKERLSQDATPEAARAWRKMMKALTDRIAEYNELKLSERYLAEEFLQ